MQLTKRHLKKIIREIIEEKEEVVPRALLMKREKRSPMNSYPLPAGMHKELVDAGFDNPRNVSQSARVVAVRAKLIKSYKPGGANWDAWQNRLKTEPLVDFDTIHGNIMTALNSTPVILAEFGVGFSGGDVHEHYASCGYYSEGAKIILLNEFMKRNDCEIDRVLAHEFSHAITHQAVPEGIKGKQKHELSRTVRAGPKETPVSKMMGPKYQKWVDDPLEQQANVITQRGFILGRLYTPQDIESLCQLKTKIVKGGPNIMATAGTFQEFINKAAKDIPNLDPKLANVRSYSAVVDWIDCKNPQDMAAKLNRIVKVQQTRRPKKQMA